MRCERTESAKPEKAERHQTIEVQCRGPVRVRRRGLIALLILGWGSAALAQTEPGPDRETASPPTSVGNVGTGTVATPTGPGSTAVSSGPTTAGNEPIAGVSAPPAETARPVCPAGTAVAPSGGCR